jgi:hypothetical protein
MVSHPADVAELIESAAKEVPAAAWATVADSPAAC